MEEDASKYGDLALELVVVKLARFFQGVWINFFKDGVHIRKYFTDLNRRIHNPASRIRMGGGGGGAN